MSLYGMMRTGVSGMAGQANRLSAVADNIANSDTTGYKRSKTEFATLVIPNATANYNSGGVTTEIRYQVAEQGVLQYTTSGSDLAINGKGFFVVQDASGTAYLTRAGSFVPDGQGRFVNAAGYFLTGYPDGTSAVTNSMSGLAVVQVDAGALTTTPSSVGNFSANLPAGSTAVAAANLPSTNTATSAYTAKTSLVAYDNLGAEVTLDVYFAKTGANAWEATVYNHADAAAGGGFPYGAAALVSQAVSFDATTGHITGGGTLAIPVPAGATVAIDMGQTTQLATAYGVTQANVDGNGPSAVEKIEFSNDGTMYATYGDGTLRALFRIPLADVPSPDMMHVVPGNVYSQSADSGAIRLGFPGEGTFGTMVSGAVEGSNVDIGNELTDMIASQRSYTANSKVFQTGADLLDILVNLKR